MATVTFKRTVTYVETYTVEDVDTFEEAVAEVDENGEWPDEAKQIGDATDQLVTIDENDPEED